MDDSAMDKTFSSKSRQYLVMGLANVQQHRQVGGRGYVQLLLKKPLLGRAVNGLHIVVEADLADRHQSTATCKRLQFFEMMGMMAGKIEWMQTRGTI
jgi:hypothetical protein